MRPTLVSTQCTGAFTLKRDSQALYSFFLNNVQHNPGRVYVRGGVCHCSHLR